MELSNDYQKEERLITTPKRHCKVLLIEGDLDYQRALMNGLSALRYEDKDIEILTVSSSVEAMNVLQDNPDIAIILLNVAMEVETSDLELIGYIRQEMANNAIRIVLLTGQAETAPVDNLVSKYEIDEYWNKADLTQEHLQTIMLSHLRTWEYLTNIGESRHGLQLLLESSQRLGEKREILDYTRVILEEIGRILCLHKGGIVCFLNTDEESVGKALIITASGEYASYTHNYVYAVIENQEIIDAITLASRQKQHVFLDDFVVLFFSNTELDSREYIVLVQLDRKLEVNEINLLQVFCENIRAGFRNVVLHSKLTALAYFDPISGMHNKNWLVKEIRNISPWERSRATLLTLYVEDLAYTESMLGAKYCDQLTLSLYGYLRDFFVKTVDIALIERDTLVILIHEGYHFDERSLERITHPNLELENSIHSLDITISEVNIADFPSYEAEQLISVGKSTLERAKHDGQSYLAFSKDLAAAMFGRYELLKDLREAISLNEITAYLQPKISLQDDSLVGFEALARWQHKGGEFIPPDQFIALAESCGLIDKLDQQILKQSCKAIKVLRDIGVEVPISINVTGNEITRPDYFQSLKSQLEEASIPSYMIELEITESQLIEEKAHLNQRLAALREIGVLVHIDDFGTGYSSLAYLASLPVSTLKIDHSFVWRMDESDKDRQILKMIIELGEVMGLNVVAEGIETQKQKEQLAEMGCKNGQGFLFARPMSLEEVINWVKERP
ncbi:EAL domain-containing protein [Marinomonas transparens]|uniref:EAL domain-containing protein n=1 Tax=Marinomonas transparens TaxID=2795388 RepID=A0A934JQL6_9GAMM|nr:EAL domain-containing protein [Marinomonas transparens]MBJ7536451.1 EAL domain-containing protein [Marinomonas transparens]